MNMIQVDSVHGELIIAVSIGSLPTVLSEVGEQYFTVQEAIKKLEAREEVLKKHIMNQMPVGPDPKSIGEITVDGIRHLAFEQASTKWKEACNTIIEEIVPKDRRADADVIVSSMASAIVKHKVTKAGEGAES